MNTIQTTSLTITAEDNELGIPRNSRECPVAFALARERGGEWSVGAGSAHRIDSLPRVEEKDKSGRWQPTFKAPRRFVVFGEKLTRAIQDFDMKGVPIPCKAYELILEVP